MFHFSFSVRGLLLTVFVWLSLSVTGFPAYAAVDNYVTRYLQVNEPIPLKISDQGDTRLFAPEELSTGKRLFEENCLNCHVGGATLPDPNISLALKKLQGATPARDNIKNLVAYFRQPMVYDGSEPSFWCRQISERWLSQDQVESLAAFILRAAEKAPGWGSDSF
ncbi:MAG: photosystem II cytochrome PsbV2 [Scytolyngbya sp. HA4215-MV1]|jgi:photosystem II cytochrome c550|nr:photosystem II cytochrome PsbV2 [Scytolyngbya sp. HA4215-MV1]